MEDVVVGIPGPLFRVTATNTVSSGSGTSAAAVSGSYTPLTAANRLAVTHFSGASSVSAHYTIESPAGTAIWQKTMSGTNHSFTENFDPPLYITTANQAVVFKGGIMAATNTGNVNGAGYEIR